MKLLFSVCVLSHALQPPPIYRSSSNSTVTADPSRQLAAPLYCSFRSQAGLSPAQRTQAAANTDAQFVSQSNFGRRERGSRCPRASATPHPGSVAAVTLLSSQAPVCLQVSVSICRLRLGSARLGLLFAALTEEGKEEEEGANDCCLATGGRELSDSQKTGC